MANEEQLSLLKQGIDAWIQWCYKTPNIQIDLSDANLKDTNLSCVDLRDAELYSADLRSADLSGADL